MGQALHDAWWRLATQHQPATLPDALACRALHAASVAYGGIVALRNRAYDRGWLRQADPPCRVVSVGNLTVGGTGKTACVELLARKLTAMGRRVAVLSRGYGGSRRGVSWLRWDDGRLIADGRPLSHPDGIADEPRLLAMRLRGVPVIVGGRRDRTAWVACRDFACDTVVLDDGFQHRRLRRDCEIVLIHSRMPLGGWALLPRGPMREPLSSLKRSHVIVITRADDALGQVGALGERLRSLNPEATLLTAAHQPTSLIDGLTGKPEPLQRLDGRRVGLVSSIGDPAGFDATIRRLQAAVSWHRAFPDHHPYRPADWQALCDQVRASQVEALVTTEKDWVRLKPLALARGGCEAPVWILGVRMQMLSGEEALDARLVRLYVR
ncbi:MAG: tetraacyldisaccharide 4'-kinase [Candidatus Omnitrophota bacterium]|nr:tetraacyldisaccharide 4'-kinase [Candidatus Omnitrophota bacterium]